MRVIFQPSYFIESVMFSYNISGSPSNTWCKKAGRGMAKNVLRTLAGDPVSASARCLGGRAAHAPS